MISQFARRFNFWRAPNSLTDTDWVALSNATNVSGTGAVVQVTDTEPGAGGLPSRFYRVVLLPP